MVSKVSSLDTSQSPPIARPRRILIEPSRSWQLLNIGELWAFRDLFFVLASRDVKLRYRQTALGVVWVVLQPLLASLIFAVIFGRLANLPSDQVPYLLFVYAALLPWNLFAGTLQRAGGSLISDARLIAKVYFPRMVIPIASSGAVIIDFGVAMLVMAALLLGYQVTPTWRLLTLPLMLALALLIAIGVSLWVAAFSVYYRDFTYALPFIVQVWMYASPVVYSGSLVPDEWRLLYALNPLAGAIDGFRWALLGSQPFPAFSLGLALLMGLLIFLGGAIAFRRVERTFADVI